MKVLRKIIAFLFIFTFGLFTNKVDAHIMTAQDFKAAYDEYYDGTVFKSHNLVADENTLKIYRISDNALLAEVDCSPGYIEYDLTNSDEDEIEKYNYIYSLLFQIIECKLGYFQRESFTSENTSSENFALYLYLENFLYLDDIEKFNNYSNEQLEEYYEKYGFIEKCSENNCYYMKLSFDTDKKDLLYQTENIRDDINVNLKKILMLTPSVVAEDIKKQSAKIYPTISNANLPDDKNFCYVYRSTSRDTGYIRINSNKIKCNGEYGVLDDTLTPGTTYYYKARLVYTNQYIEPIEVTTSANTTKKVETNETTTTKSTTEKTNPNNPETGVSSHIILTTIIVSLGIVVMNVLKRRKLFGQF